jgi:putative type I restriction-modification enzyme, S subunit, ecoA family
MTAPKLRFKEFSYDWEDKSLGDIATFTKGKGISKSDIVSYGKNPCIRYGELYTVYGVVIDKIHSFTDLDIKNYTLSKVNQVIIPASGETKIDIATASCVLVDNVILGGDLNILTTNENGVFLANYLNFSKKIEIAQLAQGISVIHLYAKQLAGLNVKLPCIEEQTKIANFLTAVDEKISQLNEQHQLMIQYKKGVMQKIFSQEIRFKDDNGEDFGEWEEKLLGDIVTFSRGKGISKSDITKNGKNPCIRYGELYTKYGVVIDEINSFTDLKLKDCVLSKANQVIIPASGETKIDIATASCVLVDNVILGGDINILTSNENGIFLANYLNFSKRMEISQLAQGISVIHLYAKQLANLSIKLPCVKEQDKIAKFLRVLDNKIESLALQLELTKTWKKGLLQKMFV